jgi:hypothetical protein
MRTITAELTINISESGEVLSFSINSTRTEHVLFHAIDSGFRPNPSPEFAVLDRLSTAINREFKQR